MRRTPKTGITSAKVKRGSFSVGRNGGITRRPSTYIPSKLQADFRSVSVQSVSRSISKEEQPMNADDIKPVEAACCVEGHFLRKSWRHGKEAKN